MLRRRPLLPALIAALLAAAPAFALGRPDDAGRPDGAGPSELPSQASPPVTPGEPPRGDAPVPAGGGPKRDDDQPGRQGDDPHDDARDDSAGSAAGDAGDGEPSAVASDPEGEQVVLPQPGRPPVLSRAVVAAPVAGEVLVKTPGMDRKVALEEAARVPVGSKVDATAGEIALRVALPGGGHQQATVGGGKFKVRQLRSGMTTFVLRGGGLDACPSGGDGEPLASASSVRGKRGKRGEVRRLFAKDRNGKFRTHGANSVATVRGTEWVTIDRCDGTLTIVHEGSVVVHDERRDRDVVVRAGERYLARAAG